MPNQKPYPPGTLTLADGTVFRGQSFGAPGSRSGEVVFNTGMVGYPETLTDPSYCGQILVLTYPLIGNYGVPAAAECFEAAGIALQGLVVAHYSPDYSHAQATRSLGQWLCSEGVPALTGIDTRQLACRLRAHGTLLGKIEMGEEVPFYDPEPDNLVARVSRAEPAWYGEGMSRVLLLDCGAKQSILRALLRRHVRVLCLPWDHPLPAEPFDGLVVSNGPGNPKRLPQTIATIQAALAREMPVLGICLGHQLMALAAGGETYKMKYGHRSQNQPVILAGTDRCFITSQNHGYAVAAEHLPDAWRPWFTNLNDGTNEGLRHATLPFLSVQFHPEAAPGPTDTDFVFDDFLALLV